MSTAKRPLPPLGKGPTHGEIGVSVEETENYYLKNRHRQGEFRYKKLLAQRS